MATTAESPTASSTSSNSTNTTNSTSSASVSKDVEESKNNLHLQPQLIASPYWGPQEDEVSLIDIALVVLKHKKTLFGVFFLIIALGTAAIMVMPEKYKYAVVIETGTYALPDENGNLGERKVIEPVGHTKSKLETSFIPQVMLERAADDPDIKLPKFEVTVPQGANLVEISARAPESRELLIKSLLAEVAQKVSEDHATKSSDVLEELQQNVESMEIKIQELAAKLVENQRDREVTQLKLQNIKAEQNLLDRQIGRINTEIEQLQQHRVVYLKDDAKSKDALALLLIDNEISQSARQRDELENQLYIELPAEKADFEKQFESQAAKIKIVDAELSRAREIYNRYAVKGESSSLFEAKKNIFPTTLSVNPYRYMKPEGVGKAVKLVIVGLCAIFMALMMTFVTEFVGRVRRAE